MEEFRLTGRHILVTGASSGIGRACAILIAKLGGIVCINGRDKMRLEGTLKELQGEGHTMILEDLVVDEFVGIGRLLKEVDLLDGIVFCAGIVKPFPIKFLDFAGYDSIMRTNFYSPAILSSKLLKAKKIKEGASLVYLSSIAAQHPYKGGAAYSASKAALEAYCKTLALEVAHLKVRANCIAPAMVKTPIYAATSEIVSNEKMKENEQQYPLGVGEVDDVANAAAYLLGLGSKWVTGTVLRMDGGLSVGA